MEHRHPIFFNLEVGYMERCILNAKSIDDDLLASDEESSFEETSSDDSSDDSEFPEMEEGEINRLSHGDISFEGWPITPMSGQAAFRNQNKYARSKTLFPSDSEDDSEEEHVSYVDLTDSEEANSPNDSVSTYSYDHMSTAQETIADDVSLCQGSDPDVMIQSLSTLSEAFPHHHVEPTRDLSNLDINKRVSDPKSPKSDTGSSKTCILM
ncbi:hypothetical protein DSO57_1016126 [Entomophthora muscae]|uniref:Uncharacterized protein n=1 Tax=Entomophthora muscae TaxID=34485 RepID=A0ACC2SHU8_9FUNG|nr:hypothetical protein DSO57_1016126 [Entomophthora muscae]